MMKASSLFSFLTKRHIGPNPYVNQGPATQQQLTTSSVDVDLERLMELVNLESSDREKSVEFTTLSQIVPVSTSTRILSTSYVDASDAEDAEDAEDQLDPQPPNSELVQEPFPEIESENAHVALFKFLFEPIDPNLQNEDSPDMNLSDEVIRDLEHLKDRIQYRYNVLKRNLFNSQSHE
jgi:hypothetical protein